MTGTKIWCPFYKGARLIWVRFERLILPVGLGGSTLQIYKSSQMEMGRPPCRRCASTDDYPGQEQGNGTGSGFANLF